MTRIPFDPDAIHIDWENYEHPERLGPQLARWIPLAGEDATVEPHIDWRRWFEISGCDLLPAPARRAVHTAAGTKRTASQN